MAQPGSSEVTPKRETPQQLAQSYLARELKFVNGEIGRYDQAFEWKAKGWTSMTEDPEEIGILAAADIEQLKEEADDLHNQREVLQEVRALTEGSDFLTNIFARLERERVERSKPSAPGTSLS